MNLEKDPAVSGKRKDPEFVGAPLFLVNFIQGNRSLIKRLEPFEPLRAASSFAGLLLAPELQSNCLRLEVLIHLCLSLCRGKRKMTSDVARQLFWQVGNGACGMLEDPAEDVFVSQIETSYGNFRVLEGIWEANTFALQRLMNVLGDLPPAFDDIRSAVNALLILSDSACERAGLKRYQSGNAIPAETLSRRLLARLPSLRRHVTFSLHDLSIENFSVDALAEFAFDPKLRNRLMDEGIFHSTLERYPVAMSKASAHLLLPTAVSAAIRRFVLERMHSAQLSNFLAEALAFEHGRELSGMPLLGKLSHAPLNFVRNRGGLFASASLEVDPGRHLNVTLFSDTLEHAESTGLASSPENSPEFLEELARLLGGACNAASSLPDFRDGICLLVGCGIGRPLALVVPTVLPPKWRIQFISAYDLATLSWLPDMDPLVLWRLFEAEQRLGRLGMRLQNVNGLLNLVAWVDSLDGHLVPHHHLPDDYGWGSGENLIVISQNGLLDLRRDVAQLHDFHRALDVSGNWVRVCREGQSHFDDDKGQPLFVADPRERPTPSSVYETQERSWWCEVETIEYASPSSIYERWRMLNVWLGRLVPVLDRYFPGLPEGALCWRVCFASIVGDEEGDKAVADPAVIASAISVEVDPRFRVVKLNVGHEFDDALIHPKNIAERELIVRAVEGFAQLAGATLSAEESLALVNKIVPSDRARFAHRMQAAHFRDFIRTSGGHVPLAIHSHDAATVKLGMGWRVRDRRLGSLISGQEECTTFLNALVSSLQDELIDAVRTFDKASLAHACLLTHELAAVDRDRWRRTSSALLALHSDRTSTLKVMAKHDFELNAVFQSSRLLVEFAVAESPVGSGLVPGALDLSRLMALVQMVVGLGGWSDAIRWGAMKPEVKISPAGDVLVNQEFLEDVVNQFGHSISDARIEDAAESYPRHFDPPSEIPTVAGLLEQEFEDAWIEEFGFSIDELRAYADFLENLGRKENKFVFAVRRSRLLQFEQSDPPRVGVATAILEHVSLPVTDGWTSIPTGYHSKDRHPWRYRRRLSVLRKPIVPITGDENPLCLVTPGLFRDAMIYSLGHLHRGDFPPWQLKSNAMKSWAGRSTDLRGNAFTKLVGEKLRELGWSVELEVSLPQLLNMPLDRNYGDIDVLAWRPRSNRLLLVECKDVQFRKTLGEIAEQLSDFLGEIKADGKPDALRRHLDRTDVVRKNAGRVSHIVAGDPLIEAHLVFRNRVPMEFAWKRMAERISIATFDNLARM